MKTTGDDATDIYVNMTLSYPVTEWHEQINEIDILYDYEIIFAALFVTIFSMIFPHIIIPYAASKIAPLMLNDRKQSFIRHDYMPLILDHTKHLELSSM